MESFSPDTGVRGRFRFPLTMFSAETPEGRPADLREPSVVSASRDTGVRGRFPEMIFPADIPNVVFEGRLEL